MSLSDAACRRAKPKEKPYKLTDQGWLYLLVKPNGSRLWQMGYRFGGKQKCLSFGPFPTVDLTQARAKCQSAKELLSAGKDPMRLLRRIERWGPEDETFKFLADEWWELKRAAWKPAHASRVHSRIKRDLLPELGHRLIGEISPQDLLQVLRKIEERGATHVAHQASHSIGQIFRYAIAVGKAEFDPTSSLRGALKAKARAVHHHKISPRELPKFFADLRAYDVNPITQLAIEFVLHTMVRTSEARSARFSEFDTSGASPLWRIPAERMKAGRPHLVPLSDRTVTLVRKIQALNPTSEFLFASPRGGVICANTMIFALYRMGYKGKLTIHGFRGMASTALNESGLFRSDWIEAQLAHIDTNRVRSAYNSAVWLKHRVQMMAWWSGFLERERTLSGVLYG
jgi:integrase